MEFLFDANYTSTTPIPAVPTGSGEPGRVWTQDGELRVRSEIEAGDHAEAAALAVGRSRELIELRYGPRAVPEDIRLGDCASEPCPTWRTTCRACPRPG
ncbi:hypothetical protein GCM10029992_67260 [Glycomyces albus]